MRLRLRLIWLLISSLWREKFGLLGESVLSLRVLPNDIDVTKITNDRYVALTDLGRIDLVLGMGLLKTLIRRKWVPIASCLCIRYRHPLRVFEKYQLRSRIIYWDEESFYLQQRFVRHGRTIATLYLQATYLGPHGVVTPKEVFAATSLEMPRPEQPKIVAALREMCALIHDEQAGEEHAPS